MGSVSLQEMNGSQCYVQQSEDILAGPHIFNGLFESEDLVLRLGEGLHQ